jgi:hypothetical protein
MISHSIVVKEVKSNVVPWVDPRSPRITDNASLSKYLESMPFAEGDFVCYGQSSVHMLGQCLLVCDVERDFKYLTFTSYNNFPKVLQILSMGSVDYPQAQLFKRWDSCEAFRIMTKEEINKLITPKYDLILDRCKEHIGSEILAKLEAYRAVQS